MSLARMMWSGNGTLGVIGPWKVQVDKVKGNDSHQGGT